MQYFSIDVLTILVCRQWCISQKAFYVYCDNVSHVRATGFAANNRVSSILEVSDINQNQICVFLNLTCHLPSRETIWILRLIHSTPFAGRIIRPLAAQNNGDSWWTSFPSFFGYLDEAYTTSKNICLSQHVTSGT